MISLKFPSGLTLSRAAQRAKDKKNAGEYTSLTEAYNAIAMEELNTTWAKARDILKNHQSVKECSKWIFVPLSNETATNFWLWIRGEQTNHPTFDKKLKDQIEIGIPSAFEKANLKYDEKNYGKFSLSLFISQSGSDGILVPETYFLNLSDDIKRYDNPRNK